MAPTRGRAGGGGLAPTAAQQVVGGSEAPFADVLDEMVGERDVQADRARSRTDRPVSSPRSRRRAEGDDVAGEEAQQTAQKADDASTPAPPDAEESGIVPLAEVRTPPVAEAQEAEETARTTPAQSALWQVEEAAEPPPGGALPAQSSPPPVAPVDGGGLDSSPAGAQHLAGGSSNSALGLLSAQELMDPAQIQVEADGGELFERLQQALAAGSSSRADDVGEVVVPQVVRNMAALARNGITEMRLQLQPGDLGEIELRVRAVEGVVRGEVMVQHAEVKQLLDTQMDRLRAALAQHGLRLEGLDVGVSDQGAAHGRDREPGKGQGSLRGGLSGTADDEVGRLETPSPTRVPDRPLRLDPDAIDWLV